MSTPIVPTLKGQCIAEFLGTALLIFFGTGCVAALKLGGADLGLWEICIIWGIGVSMAVYHAAGVSGAHLNPAVTIALCENGGAKLGHGSGGAVLLRAA